MALGAYVLAATALLGRTWFGGHLPHVVVGRGTDPAAFVWFLAWVPHALAHGHWPFFTTLVMAPGGANLMNATSIALPALLMWPVTALFGPEVASDVLCTFAIGLSAWVTYLLLRRFTTHHMTAWLGGLIYGFGGFSVGQAAGGHLHLVIAVFPPLVAMLLDDMRRGRRNPLRNGVLLGVCVAAQVFINEETLALTALMAALAVAVAAVMIRPDKALVLRFVRTLSIAAAVAVLLAGPAIAYQFAGPQAVHTFSVPAHRYVNDLASFIVPNRRQLLAPGGLRHVSDGFTGYDGEYGGFLGIPLLALLIWAGWRLRRRALVPALVLAVAAALSLGAELHVWGHDTGIPLPWKVARHLPLMTGAVPTRFNLYVWLCTAALIALLVDDLRRRPPVAGRAVAWSLTALALIPIIPAPAPSQRFKVPRVIANAAAFKKVLPGAKTVLITPYVFGELAMYAQAKAGFAYRIPDGAVYVPGSSGTIDGIRPGPLAAALIVVPTGARGWPGATPCIAGLSRSPAVPPACRSLYLADMRRRQIDTVVVTTIGIPDSVQRYRQFFTSLLGAPRNVGGASVFKVPAP